MAFIQPTGQRALFGDEADDLTLVKPPAEPRVQRGDLWALGDHLLLCGDATNETDVGRLLSAAPESPFLMVTDPPYGVGYDTQIQTGRRAHMQRRKGKLLNDDSLTQTGGGICSIACSDCVCMACRN